MGRVPPKRCLTFIFTLELRNVYKFQLKKSEGKWQLGRQMCRRKDTEIDTKDMGPERVLWVRLAEITVQRQEVS
jgi:hypothetical protein